MENLRTKSNFKRKFLKYIECGVEKKNFYV